MKFLLAISITFMLLIESRGDTSCQDSSTKSGVLHDLCRNHVKPNVTSLIIRDASISGVLNSDVPICRNLTNLRIFDISNIKFSEINVTVLESCWYLQEVKIVFSDLKLIEANLLADSPNIRILTLKENHKLASVPTEFLGQFVELEKLDLSFNELTYLQVPERLSKLREVILKGNKLYWLEVNLKTLPKLEVLRLASKQLDCQRLKKFRLKVTTLSTEGCLDSDKWQTMCSRNRECSLFLDLKKWKRNFWLGFCGSVLGFSLVLIIVSSLGCRRRSKLVPSPSLASPPIELDSIVSPESHSSNAYEEFSNFQVHRNVRRLEINKNIVEYSEEDNIGRGNAGRVYRAKQNGVAVALKLFDLDVQDDVAREAVIGADLEHKNIVRILNFSVQNELAIVMELLKEPIVTHIVQNSAQITLKKLLRFVKDIAEGMEYLVQKQIIHRDLAARNILISFDDVAKISDFGLAQIADKRGRYYTKNVRPLPVIWYAPEAIEHSIFSHEADVWSFGVTLYEIFSMGAKPYQSWFPGSENIEWRLLGTELSKGRVLERPINCPQNVYESLMKPCWALDPTMRPTFTEFVELLGQDEIFCDQDKHYMKYVTMNNGRLSNAGLE